MSLTNGRLYAVMCITVWLKLLIMPQSVYEAYLSGSENLFGAGKVAKHISLIYSLIETCRMSMLRPVKYIADVLKLIRGETNYASLLPVKITK
mgnify:CR=1 FL=1